MRSLRVRLIAWFVGIELILILVTVVLVQRHVTRSLQETLDGQIRSRLFALASAIEEEGEDVELNLSTGWLLDFQPGAPAFFQALRGDGARLLSSPSLGEHDLTRELSQSDDVRWLDASQVNSVVLWSDQLNGEEVRVGRLLMSTRAPTGHRVVPYTPRDAFLVFVGNRTADLRAQEQALIRLLLWIGGGVLLVSILGGFALATLSLWPVRRLAKQVSEITELHSEQRVDDTGLPTELRPLSRGLNQTLDRLAESFARERRFMTDASHELRTPVSVSLAAAEVALLQDRSPEEYREALTASRDAGQRVQRLLERMMTLAEADRRASALNLTEVNLGALVDEVIQFLRPLSEQHGVVVRWNPPEVPLTLSGDADLLRELAVNLTSNAVIHNHRGGWAEVAVIAEADRVALRVADGGPGIPPDHLPHLFERFYRVDKGRARKVGGSGLGLSIALWIAETHGGTVEVRSEVGIGSVFTAWLRRNGPNPR